MAFEGSTRRSRLPKDWTQRRARVKARANGRCEWVESGARCTEVGTDCDHVRRGDDHSMANLQWLCEEHHRRKTGREGRAARAKGSRTRPPERHPGLK